MAVGRWLPPGTLVHGKLANGLALESRITPVFVGRGFGNYEDRARRPDIRYLLTYVSPSPGLESQARKPGDRGHPGGLPRLEGRARVRRRRNRRGGETARC